MHPVSKVIFQQMLGEQKYSNNNADRNIAD